MSVLTLVRHAQASFAADDYDRLSLTGHKQAYVAGEYLHASAGPIDVIYSGELRRHLETADGIAKTVRTAVANAENTQSVDVDRLFVKFARVDEAGMWKRFTSRAQGRATRVRKRLSHITIILDEVQERS